MAIFRLVKKPVYAITRKMLEHQQDLVKIRAIEIVGEAGERGVDLLSSATPVDSGETASSWSYGITAYNDAIFLEFRNSNINDGIKVAMILQYGHATSSGYYVEGIDYLNEPQQAIFNEAVEQIWREVCRI